jgi:hypothetical protein
MRRETKESEETGDFEKEESEEGVLFGRCLDVYKRM